MQTEIEFARLILGHHICDVPTGWQWCVFVPTKQKRFSSQSVGRHFDRVRSHSPCHPVRQATSRVTGKCKTGKLRSGKRRTGKCATGSGNVPDTIAQRGILISFLFIVETAQHKAQWNRTQMRIVQVLSTFCEQHQRPLQLNRVCFSLIIG